MTRTSLLTLTALAALATSALAPTSASALGGRPFQPANFGRGGNANLVAMHPVGRERVMPEGRGPGGGFARVPALKGPAGPTGSSSVDVPGCQATWCHPARQPSGNGPNQGANGQSGGNGPWNKGPNGQGGNGPWNKGGGAEANCDWHPCQGGNGQGGNGGNGPWAGGNEGRPCGYGGCEGHWPRPWWRRPWWGPAVYPTQTTYIQAPTTDTGYTQPPTQAYARPAPTYAPPVQTYAPPVQTYAPPAQNYTQAPPQTYTQPPAQNYAQAPAPNCNCLTKSYMQDGSVVFSDVCTRETAMAAPAGYQQPGQQVQPAQPTTY